MNKTTKLVKAFSGILFAFVFAVITITAFVAGYVRGYGTGKTETEAVLQKFLANRVSATTKPVATPGASITPKVVVQPKTAWGGPQLWDAVNARRIQLGVNPLSVREEICTIASIRLNQILELGKLDGHVGFSNMATDRPDLKWIFEKYNLSEFLVSGADSPQEAVSLWENTLGHKELLNGGQYVWGCVYAQNGFGVAIAAY
jgi:uncharacterized protein YkwD